MKTSIEIGPLVFDADRAMPLQMEREFLAELSVNDHFLMTIYMVERAEAEKYDRHFTSLLATAEAIHGFKAESLCIATLTCTEHILTFTSLWFPPSVALALIEDAEDKT